MQKVFLNSLLEGATPKNDFQLTVYYSVDGGDWSEQIPLTDEGIDSKTFENLPEEYMTPGSHTITFCYQHNGEPGYTLHELNYHLNSPPVIDVTTNEPLSLKPASTDGVCLPITVSDADDDSLMVFYRFNDDEIWSHLPKVNGVYVLPADAFADRAAAVIEVMAWDGLNRNEDRVNIPYAKVEEVAQPKVNGEIIAEDSDNSGGLEPYAIIGIAVGGMALIGVIVGVAVVASRKKPESETPAVLIEDE